MLGCLASAPQLPDLLKELRIHHLAEGYPFVIDTATLPLRCRCGMLSEEIGQFSTRSRGILYAGRLIEEGSGSMLSGLCRAVLYSTVDSFISDDIIG